jgi:excinuclease ABC subunit C
MQSKQKVVTETGDSKDVFSVAENEQDICVTVLRYDKGRLCDSEHFFFDSDKMVANVRCNFLIQYYGMNRTVPQKIYVDETFDDMELVEQHLTNVRGKKCTVTVPQRGEGLKLINMCRENAYEKLAQKKGRQSAEIKSLEELKNLLGLSKTPEYIESYDISHTGGDDNVAGMIVFKNAKPLKRAYRTFNIKSFAGQDDYGSMREVLSRRFDEYFKYKDDNATDGFGKLPDLILLDGAKGQINAVLPVLRKYDIDVPVFGMVKDSKHKTRAIATTGGDISIKSNRRSFTLVTKIQDEVHRFAIGYHKKLQSKNMLQSELLEIDGVGKARAEALLKHFKSMKRIKEATVDELLCVKGVTKTVAEAIFNHYN